MKIFYIDNSFGMNDCNNDKDKHGQRWGQNIQVCVIRIKNISILPCNGRAKTSVQITPWYGNYSTLPCKQ